MGADDEDLVFQAACGDAAALKLILTQTFESIRTAVARRTPSELRTVVDPEDVVQNADIEVFQHIADLRESTVEAFIRWRSAIALNELRNTIKYYRRVKRGGGRTHHCRARPGFQESSVALLELLACESRTPSKSCIRREDTTNLRSAMEELPERYRRAIWLVHFDGHSIRSAADQLGCSERAVHGLCRRGIKLLGERMAQVGS